jgi:predicted CxxxxCH...CXXCH cytochrome family protein
MFNQLIIFIMRKLFVFVLISAFAGMVMTSCGGSGEKKNTETKVEKKAEKKAEKQFTANLENGKVIYEKSCIACHMSGVAGAAALTDKPRWETTAAKGKATLHKHVIDGYQGEHGVMPAKGTCADCSDQDLFDAMSYILHEAGVTAN